MRGWSAWAPWPWHASKKAKDVCANVDLYSGFIYRMLGISEDLFTPLFAISRVPGWCAHRVEEVLFANRIMRPAYKYLGRGQEYLPLEQRAHEPRGKRGTGLRRRGGAVAHGGPVPVHGRAHRLLCRGAVWRYAAMGLCALAAWLFPLAVPRQSAAPGALPGTHAPWCAAFGAACTAFWPVGAGEPCAVWPPAFRPPCYAAARKCWRRWALFCAGYGFFALGVVCLLAAWRVYAQREGRALALGPVWLPAGRCTCMQCCALLTPGQPAPCTAHGRGAVRPVCGFVFLPPCCALPRLKGRSARDVPRRAGSVLFLRLLGPAAACVAALHRRSGRHACFGGVCAGVAGPLGRGGCLWGNGGQRCRAGRALTALWAEAAPKRLAFRYGIG